MKLEAASKTSYTIKNEKGESVLVFEATPKTAAVVVFLLEEVARVQKEKLAAWMIEHGFATGHGNTTEDLLRELSAQIKELRAELMHLQTALEDESV